MKRSLLRNIVLLIALAAITALSFITLSASANTPESFYGVSASMDGTVSINFYYSDLGDADSVVVIKKGPDGAEKSTARINVGDITVNASGKYTVKVPMAAAEMTDYVTVYTEKNGAKLGKAITYSVASYANAILSNDKYETYHNAMRAMLNYGAMAQSHFDVNTGSLANSGIYKNNSNPVSAVTDINCAAPSLNNGTNIKFTEYSAVLESATALKFYFTYEGAGNLSATIVRDGIDVQNTAVCYDSAKGCYYVCIGNIAPTLYAKQYTVTVTDGSETITAKASVLNYLDDVIASETMTDSQKNVARAMYNHYVWTAKAAPAITACSHASLHQESANGGESTAYVCSVCGVNVKTVADSVNLFHHAPSVLAHYGYNGTLMTDSDGTVYTRFTGYTEIYFNNIHGNSNSAQIKATGKYFVIKYRIAPTETNQNSSIVVFAAAGAGNYGSNASVATQNDGEWHTVMFDLTAFMPNNFQVSADEKYYGIKVSPRFLANCGNTDTIDIAYWGLCDNTAEISGLVDEATYERYTASATHYTISTEKNACASCSQIKESVDGRIYKQYCEVCENVYAIKDISDANVFRSASEISTYSTLFMNPTYKTEYDEASGKYISYARHTYTHTDREGWIYIFGSGSTVNIGNTGRYLVMKMRTNNVSDIVFNAATGSTSTSAYTKTSNYMTTNGQWKTVVVDLALFANYQTDLDNSSFYFKWQVYRPESYTGTENRQSVDIAYAAIVDDLDEAADLIDDETYNFYGRGKTWNTVGGTHVTETLSCDGGCTKAVGDYTGYLGQGGIAYMQNGNTVYSYICSKCGVEMERQVKGSGVEYFHSALSILDHAQAGSTLMIDPDGTVFTRCNGYKELWPSVSGETGSIFVVKYRLPASNAHNSGNFQFYAKAGGGGYSAFWLGTRADGQWHTIVVDLAQTNPGSVIATDGKYYIDGLSPRFLTGCSANDGCTVDIAFMGLCNSFDDISGFAETESYDHYTSSASFTTKSTGVVVSDNSLKADLTKSERYNALANGITNGEFFTYFTDPHFISDEANGTWKNDFKNHLSIMADHHNSTKSSFVLAGGDWFNNTNTRKNALANMQEIDLRMGDLFGEDFYLLVGNHDVNYQTKDVQGSIVSSSYKLGQDEINGVWYSDARYGGKSYYSFKGENTRFYAFDSGIDWEHNSGNLTALDKEQIVWFLESLLARDDAHIALAPHILYHAGTEIHPATEKILQFSEIYNQRGTVIYDGKLYDFSEKTGYVEFLIAGHSHKDEVSTHYSIPCILTVNMGDDASYPRFDMIAVDYDTRVLYTVRVGSSMTDKDRTVPLYAIGE